MDAIERDLGGGGTAESVWRGWHALAVAPIFDFPPSLGCDGRIVVVAPHPDDELLGIGGLLASSWRLACKIVVVVVTAGEACYPDGPWELRSQLRAIRKAECRDGLDAIGLGAATVACMDLPDSAVAANEGQLRVELRQLLKPDDLVLTTWQHDGHPDHDAVGRSVAAVTRELQSRLVEFPVWMWHWAAPDDCRVPWQRARRIPLSLDVQARKMAAIEQHVSQLAPPASLSAVIPRGMLPRWNRHFEIVFA